MPAAAGGLGSGAVLDGVLERVALPIRRPGTWSCGS